MSHHRTALSRRWASSITARPTRRWEDQVGSSSFRSSLSRRRARSETQAHQVPREPFLGEQLFSSAQALALIARKWAGYLAWYASTPVYDGARATGGGRVRPVWEPRFWEKRFASIRSRMSRASRSSVFCLALHWHGSSRSLQSRVRDRVPQGNARTNESTSGLPMLTRTGFCKRGRKNELRRFRGPIAAREATLPWFLPPWQSADSVCEKSHPIINIARLLFPSLGRSTAAKSPSRSDAVIQSALKTVSLNWLCLKAAVNCW